MTESPEQLTLNLLQHETGCVIVSGPRATEAVFSSAAQKDLDILVDPATHRTLQRKLLDEGFRMELKAGSMFKALYHCYQRDKQRIFMLDLYWRYLLRCDDRLFELHADLRRELLATATEDRRGLRHAAPVFRMLFIVLGLLIKKNPYDRYREEIAEHPQAIDELLRLLADRGLSDADGRAIAQLLRENVLPEAPVVTRLLKTVAVPLPRRVTRLRWLMSCLRYGRKVLSRPFPVVAVVGLDGTGKSTMLRNIVENIPLKLRTFYWASRSSVLPTTRLYRWVQRKAQGHDVRRTDLPEVKLLPGARARRWGWSGLWKWPLLTLLNMNKYCEYFAKYALLQLHRMRGCVVVTDRYVCDERLEFQDRFYSVNRWLYRFGYPDPDILVVMSARPETVHVRRPAIPEDAAICHLAEYEKLAQEYEARGTQVLRVCSENSADQNLARVLPAIFGCPEPEPAARRAA